MNSIWELNWIYLLKYLFASPIEAIEATEAAEVGEVGEVSKVSEVWGLWDYWDYWGHKVQWGQWDHWGLETNKATETFEVTEAIDDIMLDGFTKEFLELFMRKALVKSFRGKLQCLSQVHILEMHR